MSRKELQPMIKVAEQLNHKIDILILYKHSRFGPFTAPSKPTIEIVISPYSSSRHAYRINVYCFNERIAEMKLGSDLDPRLKEVLQQLDSAAKQAEKMLRDHTYIEIAPSNVKEELETVWAIHFLNSAGGVNVDGIMNFESFEKAQAHLKWLLERNSIEYDVTCYAYGFRDTLAMLICSDDYPLCYEDKNNKGPLYFRMDGDPNSGERLRVVLSRREK